jgi:uncharacterized protein (DUF1501 family)
MPSTRRHVLRALLGAAQGAALRPAMLPLAGSLAAMAALTQPARASAGNYRALVCVFLHGGNDGHNWIVPTAPAEWAGYAQARGALALPRESLLPLPHSLQAAGRSFGLAPALAPLHQPYLDGRLAVLANVGPLLAPITRADYLARRSVPPRLFSHNDQQSTWQSLAPEGAPSGWGGRIGDLLAAANTQPVFTATSVTGNAVFLSGRSVVQYQVAATGPVGIKALAREFSHSSRQAGAALRALSTDPGNGLLQQAYAGLAERTIATEAVLTAALAQAQAITPPAATLALSGGTTALANDPLAQQLSTVARLIEARGALGMQRQVFMVSLGGFDTHARQLADHGDLSTRVAASLRWFHDHLRTRGLLDAVTTFTASEFGRTLSSNGDGSDHGWGSHHLVMGGAVRGGDIHGRMPDVALGSADDVGRGRLLPTTSVTQLAAELALWMGVAPGELELVLPGWQHFDRLSTLVA